MYRIFVACKAELWCHTWQNLENKLAVQIHFDDGAVQCVSKVPRLKGETKTHLEGIILGGFPRDS